MSRCNVCKHPLRKEIDDLLRQQDEDRNLGVKTITAEQIIEMVTQEAIDRGLNPDELPQLQEHNITRHRQNHPYTPEKLQTALVVDRKGNFFKPDGTPLVSASVKDFLKLVMARSFQDMLDMKTVVQPKDGLAAAKLYAEIASTEMDLDEFTQDWVDFREKKAKERKEKKLKDVQIMEPDDYVDPREVIVVDDDE